MGLVGQPVVKVSAASVIWNVRLGPMVRKKKDQGEQKKRGRSASQEKPNLFGMGGQGLGLLGGVPSKREILNNRTPFGV